MLKCVTQTLGPINPRPPVEETREALWALQTVKGTPWSANSKGVHKKLRWPYHRTRETRIPISKPRKGRTRKSVSQNAHFQIASCIHVAHKINSIKSFLTGKNSLCVCCFENSFHFSIKVSAF